MTGNNLVRADSRWDAFRARLPGPAELASMDDAHLEGRLDIEPGLIGRLADQSVSAWRNSPSASLVNCLDLAEHGQPGDPLFRGLLEQTRFLVQMKRHGFMTGRGTAAARSGDGRRIPLTREDVALTATDEGSLIVNNAAMALHAYAARNRALVTTGAARMPRRLLRGIRLRDLYNAPAVREALAERRATPDDRPYLHRVKDRLELALEVVGRTPLAALSHSGILSFTELASCADFFANKEGVVVEIDPLAPGVEIVTGHGVDTRLAGKDSMTGRSEREWIVRVPDDLVVPRDRIVIRDGDYLKATNDPRCVALFRHSDAEAEYVLDGHRIRAWWTWSSNTIGSLTFKSDDDWSKGRIGFRKTYGFDPMPTEANIDRVTGFTLYKRDRWEGRRELLDIPGTTASSDDRAEDSIAMGR